MNDQAFLGKPMPGIESHVIRKNQVTPTFSIGVLLYGNNFKLAWRCLDSILQLPDPTRVELRIGMNEVSAATKGMAQHIFDTENAKGRNVLLYDSSYNRGKYPMMRWMFQDPTNPVKAPLIQWFDDDSFIHTPTREWLDNIEVLMNSTDMCGALMSTKLTETQALWITMQPWYRGKRLGRMVSGRTLGKSTSTPLSEPYIQRFVVGGWWTIKTNVFTKLNWPPQNIIHRGGDSMLGEAMRQNDYCLTHYDEGIGINADDNGVSHKATRRGLDPLPVGMDYEAPLTVVLHDATKDIEPSLLDYPGL